jgi:Domain of unknown function (DUF4203)
MIIFDLVFGFLLVFAGRNFFWLCVGTIGFLVGIQCAAALDFTDDWMALFIALVLGCLGALLAISFEWFTVVFGVGFLGGGYLLMNLFYSLVQQDPYSWLIFVVGGIVGMCLMVIIFDWTLIIISSLLGATLLVHAFHGAGPYRDFVFVASVVAGVMVQYLTKGPISSMEKSRRN